MRAAAAAALVGVALGAGCGGRMAPPVPPPVEAAAAAAAAETDTLRVRVPPAAGQVRHRVELLPVRPDFLAAVESGTRTLDGRPGSRYWQQRVQYRIDAELDPETAVLRGQERLIYRNRSRGALPALVFHLYQNAFDSGVSRTQFLEVTGGMRLGRVAVDGTDAGRVGSGRATRSGPRYAVAGTLMTLALGRPLASGDSVVVEIDWSFEVPELGAPRMGRFGRELYSIAQWYPAVAVYDDVAGWHDWPYLTDGEFYLDYGDYDVSITLPEGWVVGATGELQNPDEVLSERTRSRLARAARGDEVVPVVREPDFGPGGATLRAPGGQLTWRFAARDVRDFAFTTSDRYLWDATRATVLDADGDGRDEAVAVHALYRPGTRYWTEAARFTRHALEFHARRWGTYIYPQMTSAEGAVAGGMEYPMISFNRETGSPESLYSLLNHETLHQWWPMMVGTKEPEYAWQDEGVATYAESLAYADFLDVTASAALRSDTRRYLAIAGTEHEKPIMRHADLFGPGPARGVASYAKPGVLLRALAAVIGEESLHRALRDYSVDWRLKHPYATDFFQAVERAAGRELDWFWYPWWFQTSVLDQGIADVRLEDDGGGHRAIVTIVDEGGAPMPVLLSFTLAGGLTHDVVVPVDVWQDGARLHREAVTLPAAVEAVRIDADRVFPDVDRSDNTWERP